MPIKSPTPVNSRYMKIHTNTAALKRPWNQMISQKFPDRFGSPATKQLKFALTLHNDWFERYNINKTAFKQLSVETSYNSGHNILEIYPISQYKVDLLQVKRVLISGRTTLDLGSQEITKYMGEQKLKCRSIRTWEITGVKLYLSKKFRKVG